LKVIANKLLRPYIVLYYTEGTKKISTDRLGTTHYSNYHASICSVIPSTSFLLSSVFLHTIADCVSHVKTFVID